MCWGLQDTYRYHGHSISDPGSSYRTREEISGVRRARDPIEHVKNLLTENGFADGVQLKKIEKEVRTKVAFTGTRFLLESQFYDHLYRSGSGKGTKIGEAF